MKKIVFFVFIYFSIFFPTSFAVDGKTLSPAEEKKLDKIAARICDGMVPLYVLGLELYYKNNNEQVVRSELDKKIRSDTKNKVFYTEYLEKDPVIAAVISITSKHSKKIMEQYPGDQDVYKKSIEVTKNVSLPPVCRKDIKNILR